MAVPTAIARAGLESDNADADPPAIWGRLRERGSNRHAHPLDPPGEWAQHDGRVVRGSGFTRVTARRIAQPPKVTFVTRLRSRQLPSETARQLPDLSTIIRVEPSSTDDSRLQGALPIADFGLLSPGWRSFDKPHHSVLPVGEVCARG